MNSNHNRPAWWELNVLVIFTAAGLLGIHYLFLSQAGADLLQILATLGFYGLMLWWLRVNSAAIEHEHHYYSKPEPASQHTEDETPLTENQTRYHRTMAQYNKSEPPFDNKPDIN